MVLHKQENPENMESFILLNFLMSLQSSARLQGSELRIPGKQMKSDITNPHQLKEIILCLVYNLQVL